MVIDLPIAEDLKAAMFHCPTHDRQMTRYECSALRLEVMECWTPAVRPPRMGRAAKSCLSCCVDYDDLVPADRSNDPASKYTHMVKTVLRPKRSVAGLRCGVCGARAVEGKYNFKQRACRVCCTRAYRRRLKQD